MAGPRGIGGGSLRPKRRPAAKKKKVTKKETTFVDAFLSGFEKKPARIKKRQQKKRGRR